MLADLTWRFVSRRAPTRSRGLKGETGATLVEYAFVFIIFMTILFGITGFGHMLYAYHFVNHAAKEATRWAAVNGSTCGADSSCNGTAPMNNGPAKATDVNTYVQNHIPESIDPTKVSTSACGVAGGTACPASTPNVCTKGLPTATPPIPPTPNSPGCTVEVKVSYAYNFFFPLLPGVSTTTAPCTKPGICLSSTSEMIIAH